MSQIRASMISNLADIRSKPATPGRQRAIANIESAMSRMSDFAAQAPRGGGRHRTITFHDREKLMKITDDPIRSQKERDRALSILEGNGDLTNGDAEFLDRADGNIQ